MSEEELPISLRDVQDAAKAISSLTHLTPVGPSMLQLSPCREAHQLADCLYAPGAHLLRH